MIALLLDRLKGWALAMLALAGIALGMYGAGRRAGGRAAEEQNREAAVQAAEDRYEVDADVARRPDGDAAERLRDRWSRD